VDLSRGLPKLFSKFFQKAYRTYIVGGLSLLLAPLDYTNIIPYKYEKVNMEYCTKLISHSPFLLRQEQ
jgi:hypothetical protein